MMRLWDLAKYVSNANNKKDHFLQLWKPHSLSVYIYIYICTYIYNWCCYLCFGHCGNSVMRGAVVEYIAYQLLLSSFSFQCGTLCILLNARSVLFLPFEAAFCTDHCHNLLNLSAFLKHLLLWHCHQSGVKD